MVALLGVVCFLFSSMAFGSTEKMRDMDKDIYTFHTPQQQQMFSDILKDLRCLVCQNEDLNDSQTQFADDLRQHIHQQIIQGQSKQIILKMLASEYGDFILFNPPMKKTTYVLWYAPFILLLIGFFIYYQRVIRQK